MKVKTLSKNNVTHCRCVFSALRPEGARGLSPGVLTPGRASQRREIALKEREIKSNLTDRAEWFIPRFKDTRSLPSAALSGSHINIQDPGFRFAHPGLSSTTPSACSSELKLLKLPSAAECFLR